RAHAAVLGLDARHARPESDLGAAAAGAFCECERQLRRIDVAVGGEIRRAEHALHAQRRKQPPRFLCRAQLARQAERLRPADLAYDSRAVREGTLFFCVPGATRDGHDLAPDAVAAGAVALVVERVLDLPVPQVRVPSVRRAMAAAAVAFFGDPSHELEIAAVT